MDLLKYGYYISDGEKWEDWHVGHKEEGFSYKFLKIIDDTTFFYYSNINKSFDFLSYLKKYRTIKELLNETTVNFGTYAIIDELVTFEYVVLDKYHMKFELEIVSAELLKDLKGRLFHFIQIENKKFENLPL